MSVFNDISNMTNDNSSDETEELIVDEYVPTYKVIGNTRIPTSKILGSVWNSRRIIATKKREQSGLLTAWDEAIRYYKNDQMSHRVSGQYDRSGNIARGMSDSNSETENIVFANISALVPSIYAKNPKTEFSAIDEEDEPLANMVEHLLNGLVTRKGTPNISLTNKARRCVVMACLTNRAWLEVGYVFKNESSENALHDLELLSSRLVKAKTPQEVTEIEGEITALEHKIDLLQSGGPFVKYRRPHQILIDPEAIEDDLSDANWVMVSEFLSTEYIKAIYATKNDDGTYSSIYNPTHVISLTSNDNVNFDSDSNLLSILDTDYSVFGYDNDTSYKKAQHTKVWTVWCKTTRRVYLFNDADWSWPIWVWDDPYKLDTFFPFFPLSFYTDPEGGETKGETTYYLDQQDAINEMLSEQRLARACARRHIVYNSNLITQEGAERILKGADGTVVGVDLPDGVKITDVVFSVPPPAVQFGQLFDPTQKYAAIDRISPVSDVMRGAQYKTNTTNQAIEQYNRTGSIRLDERQDALENFLSSVFWGIAQLCLQFMDKETVMSVIGRKGANWQNLTSTEISRKFSVSVVSGSTAKPTSEKKKREAIEIAQILGQFANATPVAAIVALKVFARAFDEIIISEDDWKTIKQALEQSITQGNNAHKGGEDQISQIEQMIDSLPPQAKQAIGQALAQGAPIRAILEQVMARVGNQQQQQTGVENE